MLRITDKYIEDGAKSKSTTPSATSTQNTTAQTTAAPAPAAPAVVASAPAVASVAQQSTAAPAIQPFSYAEYAESDAVKQANALLQQHIANKPGEYQSQWQSQINDYLNQIQNRGPFTYDLNADALYQQYKDNYIRQGQMAMMDTMGQAAALTGGYGNSYAQTAGQQTYQGYLQGLNDRIPELYQLALQKYQMEGNELMNKYGLLTERENADYGRYRDQLGDYNDQLNYLQSVYNNERSFDYGKYADALNFNYGMHRDAIADQQWQTQFDEDKRRYDQEWALATAKSSGGGGGSGGGWDNGGVGESAIAQMQDLLGVTPDGKWGSESRAAAEALYGISDPAALYKQLHQVGNTGDTGDLGNGFSGSTYSEAVAYLQSNGISGAEASSIMSQTEWQRRKNAGSTSPYVTSHNTYQEYLESIVDYKLAPG